MLSSSSTFNWKIDPKLALFLLILFKVRIISKKLAFLFNSFSASSIVLLSFAERSDQGVHDQAFDRCLPFPRWIAFIKTYCEWHFSLKHGILEVRIVLLWLKIILGNDSYQIINTCHCIYRKRKWNNFHVKDSILFSCFMIKITKHLTRPINGTILHCHALDCKPCIILLQIISSSCWTHR